jgi:N-dimethylarginine dimethylaminohydrolase
MVDAGIEVTILPPDNDHPDCTFVEDQAVCHRRTCTSPRPRPSIASS